jgi:toxin ParE1/3/4
MRNLYTLLRTETADSCLRKIVLFIAEKIGNETALDRLDRIEREISILAENPYAGIDPRYMVLRRQGFKVLILEKDLVFYKINEAEKIVTIYAITDQRQDYLKILRGL